MDVTSITLALALVASVALLTLAALLGVLSRKERTEDQARAFLAGFTYVLSDDPDAAIAELSRAVRLDTEALETYFALGALFRRKGDLERAVRLHTNIVLRPGLAPEMKRRAQIALVHDYRRGGLKDKALEVLEKILTEAPDHREALVLCRQLHEEREEWEAALESQLKVVELEKSGHLVLAHLCAAASRALPPERFDEALRLAERAVALASDNADSQLAAGQLLLKAGEKQRAGERLERAFELEPAIAPTYIEALHEAVGSKRAEAFLLTHRDRAPAYALALALLYRRTHEPQRAERELQQLTDRRPHYWEARKELGALLLARDSSADLRVEFAEILGTLGRPALGFQCAGCRQQLAEHSFRCPSCSAWDTVREADSVGLTREPLQIASEVP